MPKELIRSRSYRPVCKIWMLIGLLALIPTLAPAKDGHSTVKALGTSMAYVTEHPSQDKELCQVFLFLLQRIGWGHVF